jgi:hypothetical protein
MRRSILLVVTLCLSLTVPAFAAEPAKAGKGGEEAHASKDAKPGSYEDWCGEHGVPDSQCTRCDKALIPVFKATGDWCQKHGLPLSQCLKCDPKLKIVRPPKGSN